MGSQPEGIAPSRGRLVTETFLVVAFEQGLLVGRGRGHHTRQHPPPRSKEQSSPKRQRAEGEEV